MIHGVSAHSGNNYLAGRNAILEAAYKVIGIQALNDLEKGTHMNPAIVRGGTVMNAIPDSCELDFSGRFPTLAEVERVKEGLAKLFGESTIEGTHSEYTLSAARGGLEVTEEGKRLRRFVQTPHQLRREIFLDRLICQHPHRAWSLCRLRLRAHFRDSVKKHLRLRHQITSVFIQPRALIVRAHQLHTQLTLQPPDRHAQCLRRHMKLSTRRAHRRMAAQRNQIFKRFQAHDGASFLRFIVS